MKKLTLIGMTLIAMLSVVSCRGPQGPQGPAGNANVVSKTVTVPANKWRWDNNTSWRTDIYFNAITANITDYGAVLVYRDEKNTWRQLPYTFYYSEINEETNEEMFFSSSLEVSTYDEGVSIFWTENDFCADYPPGEQRFKIVVIAASVYKSRTDVDYSNYEAVKAAFQLKDDVEENAY